MSECRKCNVKFINTSEAIPCSECKNFVHAACSRLVLYEKFKKMNTQARAAWKCDDCVGSSEGTLIGFEHKFKLMMDKLSKVHDDLISLINAKNNEVLSQIDTLNKKSEDTNIRLEALKADNSKILKTCEELEGKNAELTKRIITLENDMNLMHQRSRMDNIEINGIAQTKNEDLLEILKAISKALNVNFKPEDVSVAHRVPNYRKSTSIIVKFISRNIKNTWLNAAKVKKSLNSTEIDQNLEKAKVYINEHLSPYNKKLFRQARILKNEGKLTYAWVKDGKVLVRATPESTVKRIQNFEDFS